MNKYLFFYNGKQKEIEADTLYEAKVKAIAYFRVPKSKHNMVHGMIVEKEGGEQVIHSTSIID